MEGLIPAIDEAAGTVKNCRADALACSAAPPWRLGGIAALLETLCHTHRPAVRLVWFLISQGSSPTELTFRYEVVGMSGDSVPLPNARFITG